MDISGMAGTLDFQLSGMTDDDGEDCKTYTLFDLGEVFIKTVSGQHFKLTIEEIDADQVLFIDADDWS